MPQTAALLLICLAVLLTPGCKGETEQPGATGSAKANGAYRHHFGEPPTPKQGTCYARVGYFPLADDPDRVRPVPLFIFREQEQLAHMLAALPAVPWEFSPRSRLRNPYPPNSTLRISGRSGEQITIDLAAPALDRQGPDFAGLVASVVETVLQFEDVRRVVLTIAGEPVAGMPPEGFVHDPARIVPVGPPQPLMAGINVEENQAAPAEIFVNFDRPVTIEEIRLRDGNGKELRGEYFLTGFAMTVLFKPLDPPPLHEGEAIQVAWRASDRLGRTSTGEEKFVLSRHDHEEEPLPAEATNR